MLERKELAKTWHLMVVNPGLKDALRKVRKLPFLRLVNLSLAFASSDLLELRG